MRQYLEFMRQVRDHGVETVEHGLLGVRRRRHLLRDADLPGALDDSCEDLRSSKIDSDHQFSLHARLP